ncbi:hypothetical protein ABIE09_001588 [Lysobacter enzymogenes]|uniref:hypothetical protein n=1 Tax=Lysobacter enzymogenes TaxID=69 RepID=UPI003392F981
MSVIAQIDNPICKAEESFDVPVMVESICRVVSPIAKRLGLDLCDNWGTFNDVGAGMTPEFFRQLDLLAAAVTEQEPTLQPHIDQRFANLKLRMTEAVERRADVAFIIG